MRPDPKQQLEFFSRSLAAFQSSQDVFRVLCTLPHRSVSSRPSSTVRKLVVLDSSFNPPTKAHAQMARSSAREWAGEGGRLVLLLAVNNADKAPKPASFAERLGMMEGFGRALQRQQTDRGPEINLAVTKMAYFHDKARVISESGIYAQEAEQVFLTGFDTVIRIFDPKYYYCGGEGGMKAALGPFFAAARLRVTTRLDDAWGAREEQQAYVRGLADGELERVGGERAWAARVDLVEGEEEAVSSSRVREMVRRGELERARGLVDGEVMAWIEARRLYRD